ncbi:ribonuclease M5 [Lacticaseibacillus mingshuiensis]|uniref:Ribonuclease M5 n=1 Tax=Lacticaseibacillus mingshuiensis TaxID=2799574 RepID=A0ABW4CGT5_9LACO|nr:ribonuclease M5 [Lacticaseibacillus mingshuiensis]
MSPFKQIIVVEGRDDTKRLTEAFGKIDTIETRGSAIDDKTLDVIKKAQETRGVIVLTDPDFPGEKIRKTISAHVPGVQHAFLPRGEAAPDGPGSLGVEHASPAALKAALEAVATPSEDAPQLFDQSDLQAAGLIGGAGSRAKRERLGELLHIGYTNGKQLVHRLQAFGITRTQLTDALAQLDKEASHD